MPLRKAAEDMRNLYANEIARAVHAGEKPSPQQVESWAKYDRAARSRDPGPIMFARDDDVPAASPPAP